MKIKAIITRINKFGFLTKSRVNCVLKRKDMKKRGLQEAVSHEELLSQIFP